MGPAEKESKNMKTLTLLAVSSLVLTAAGLAAEPLHSPRAHANMTRTVPGADVDKLNRGPVFVHRGDAVFNTTVPGVSDKRAEACAKSAVVASPRALATYPHLAGSLVVCGK
jgi:hypothetical protein